VHGFQTDKNDHCVFTRDSRREVLIFFENNKVFGVETNKVLNILEEIKKKNKTGLEVSGGKTRGSVSCACFAHLSFCFEETYYRTFHRCFLPSFGSIG
jgi:hypothetical protein